MAKFSTEANVLEPGCARCPDPVIDRYFTNAVEGFPPDGEGASREATDEELENCRPTLVAEVEDIVLPNMYHRDDEGER